jgi:hypothetical protein
MHVTKFFRTILSLKIVRYGKCERFPRGLLTQTPTYWLRSRCLSVVKRELVRLNEGNGLEITSDEAAPGTISSRAGKGDGPEFASEFSGSTRASPRDPRNRRPSRRFLLLNAGCSSREGGPLSACETGRLLLANNGVIRVRKSPRRGLLSALCWDDDGSSISHTVVN